MSGLTSAPSPALRSGAQASQHSCRDAPDVLAGFDGLPQIGNRRAGEFAEAVQGDGGVEADAVLRVVEALGQIAELDRLRTGRQ